MDALGRVRLQFESAQTLDDLNAGADLAADWNVAAGNVNEAITRMNAPRDLLTDLGLMGTNVQPNLDAAMTAAIAGEADEAMNQAAVVINTIKGGASVGGLRIAGVVFFAVAIAGIIGMWIVFNRQRGPSWARQTKPHWLKGQDQKQLGQDQKQLGPGKKQLGPGKKK